MSDDDVHVVPDTRVTERMHELTDDCWCGTTTEPVPCDDGSFGWLIVHQRPVTDLDEWRRVAVEQYRTMR